MKKLFLLIIGGLNLAGGVQNLMADASINGQGFIYLTQPSLASALPDETVGVLNNNRFLWNPTKGAVRFGSYDGDYAALRWANGVIGNYSFAGGLNTSAQGNYSFAFGNSAAAIGSYSVSFNATACGASSFAVGRDSYGNPAYAPNDKAIAINGWTQYAGAVSLGGSSNGVNAISINGSANNDYAIAVGRYTTAYAPFSVALGTFLDSYSYRGIALGFCNLGKQKDGITTPTSTFASPNDPIFELGNGTGTASSARSNALTVYRDGTVAMGNSGNVGIGTATPYRKALRQWQDPGEGSDRRDDRLVGLCVCR